MYVEAKRILVPLPSIALAQVYLSYCLPFSTNSLPSQIHLGIELN